MKKLRIKTIFIITRQYHLSMRERPCELTHKNYMYIFQTQTTQSFNRLKVLQLFSIAILCVISRSRHFNYDVYQPQTRMETNWKNCDKIAIKKLSQTTTSIITSAYICVTENRNEDRESVSEESRMKVVSRKCNMNLSCKERNSTLHLKSMLFM